jgi:hypothetical protein
MVVFDVMGFMPQTPGLLGAGLAGAKGLQNKIPCWMNEK